MSIRILIADDEPHILLMVRKRLENKGYEVLTAPDGEGAEKMIRGQKPDIILLDVMMPGLSGVDLCKRIKADAGLKSTPVVLFSAKAQQEDKESGRKAGADAYITKPFDPQELLSTIEEFSPRV